MATTMLKSYSDGGGQCDVGHRVNVTDSSVKAHDSSAHNIRSEDQEQHRPEQAMEISEATPVIQPLEVRGINLLKLISAALCFFNAGVNDGSLGALVPYLLRSYDISTAYISITYATTFFGWLLAALVGGYVRLTTGPGGIITIGAALQLVAQLLRFWVPPFGLYCVSFFIVAVGQAFQDTQGNTFASSLQNAHRWLGLIHGSYAVGGLVGPLVAAAIASTSGGRWELFYYLPIGIGVINIALCVYAFRHDTPFYKQGVSQRAGTQSRTTSVNVKKSRMALVELKATLKQRSVWLLSLFYFLYLGAAITAGGWVVEYLHVVRKGDLSEVGYISSAYYGGIALGRFLLAEPTFRFGEKRMLLLYGIMAFVLEIVFWRVPNIVVDAVMVSFLGFWLGPAFATGVSVGSKLLPAELQSSGLMIIFVMAQMGGAAFPAITGAVAAKAGVAALQPILVGILAAMIIAWAMVPNPRTQKILSV
ncbi:MFS general substrate transporter [Polychaeton citri CBS 116435]|uniref:MFS general substrate transporter n=1 Tax=Polychaeton citri CBS 116435 TaxID=1314669 RepID=A0A9P4URA7_9PEZI|nr:MFS general substrate transporter [Polychaeton citri CBS 116435]